MTQTDFVFLLIGINCGVTICIIIIIIIIIIEQLFFRVPKKQRGE